MERIHCVVEERVEAVLDQIDDVGHADARVVDLKWRADGHSCARNHAHHEDVAQDPEDEDPGLEQLEPNH